MDGKKRPKRKITKAASGNTRRSSVRRGKRSLYWGGVLLIVAIIALVLSLTVFFKIETISVDTGDTPYSEQQVTDVATVKKGDNLWLTSPGEIRQAIMAALPYAEQVTVQRKLFDTVTITLSAPEIEAVVEVGDRSLLVSGRGRILAENGGQAVKYLGLDAAEADGYLDEAAVFALAEYNAVYLQLAEKGYIDKVDSISVESLSKADFIYDGRVLVKLGGTDKLASKIAFFVYYMENLAEPDCVGVYDVADPQRAYFRRTEWREEPEVSEPEPDAGSLPESSQTQSE